MQSMTQPFSWQIKIRQIVLQLKKDDVLRYVTFLEFQIPNSQSLLTSYIKKDYRHSMMQLTKIKSPVNTFWFWWWYDMYILNYR